MPLVLSKQRTEQWEDARLDHVTASLAAACLGEHPWISRQKAFRIITGQENEVRNHHMVRGNIKEQEARAFYELETGLLVEETGLWVHPDHPWLLASPDGLVGANGLIEIKCPVFVHDSIAVHYLIQMRVQLLVTGRAWCDFYSYVDKWDTYRQRVHVEELEDVGGRDIIGELQKFMDHIAKDESPPRKRRSKKDDDDF